MKFYSLMTASLLMLTPWSASAQTPSVTPSMTPTVLAAAGKKITPTPVPRVVVSPADENVQPPTDGPAGDDMGFMAMPKGSASVNGTTTPVNYEVMQATLTAMIPATSPTVIPMPPLPTPTPGPVKTQVSPSATVATTPVK